MAQFTGSGQIEWTRRMTLWTVGGALLLAAAGFITQLFILVALAAVAVMVAVGGRLVTLQDQRWADITEPPDLPVRIRNRRIVVPRVDHGSRFIFGLLLLGWLLVISVRSQDGTTWEIVLSSALLLPACAAFWLTGFSNRVIVTPTSITVLKTFTRHVIPRSRAGELHGTLEGALTWKVEGDRDVVIPVGMNTILIRGSWNYRPAELIAAGRILAALRALPPEPSPAQSVTKRRRPFLIALAAVSAFVFALMVILVFTKQIPLH